VGAIGQAQRQRRVGDADFSERRRADLFFESGRFAGRNPPGGGRLGHRELGQLVADLGAAQLRLGRELVAKADAVVVDAEHHREPAPGALLLLEVDAQLANDRGECALDVHRVSLYG
jgi:hypothetical protein